MTTLKDLSRHLSLSVTQVSRALNGYPDVSEVTRARVRAAAQELNYAPNLSARKLVSGRSGIVGMVLQGTPASMSGDHLLSVVGGLSGSFSRRGLQFVLHMADAGEDVIEVHRRLIDGGALDGFVLLEPRVEDPRAAYLAQRGIPHIVHGRLRNVGPHGFYDIDNEEVGRRLTQTLIDRGHRRIAFLGGEADRSYNAARLRGYRAALEAAGLPYVPQLHRARSMDEAHGLISAVHLFSGADAAPTGVAVGHVRIARGLLQGLRALGLSVPRDVSVTVHDDLLPDLNAGTFDPPLTATASSVFEAWEPLAAGLAQLIGGAAPHDIQTIAPIAFAERASVGPPRGETPVTDKPGPGRSGADDPRPGAAHRQFSSREPIA